MSFKQQTLAKSEKPAVIICAEILIPDWMVLTKKYSSSALHSNIETGISRVRQVTNIEHSLCCSGKN